MQGENEIAAFAETLEKSAVTVDEKAKEHVDVMAEAGRKSAVGLFTARAARVGTKVTGAVRLTTTATGKVLRFVGPGDPRKATVVVVKASERAGEERASSQQV